MQQSHTLFSRPGKFQLLFWSLLLVFSTISFKASSQSAKVWTLKECVDHALENNIQIKQSSLNMELAADGKTLSFAAMFPSLNATASHNYNFGRNVDPTTNLFTNDQVQSNSFSLSSNLTLFNGFQMQNSLKQSGIDLIASKYDLEKMKDDIAMNVVSAYLQVLYAKDQLKSSEEQFNTTKKQRERIAKFVEVGSQPRGALLDIESQVASDDYLVINAKNNLDISLLSLAQLLELQSVKGFDISDPSIQAPELIIESLDPDIVYATALKNQPGIFASEKRIESSQRGLQIARGARSPRLSMFGSLNSSYSSAFKSFENGALVELPFQDQIDQNFSKSLGFSLNIPIFNGLQASKGINRAKINLQRSELDDINTKNNLRKTIQQAYADALASYMKWQSSDINVNALEESLRYAEQRMTVGASASIDYINASNRLIQAKTLQLQNKYDYIFRVKILDFYQGKPLVF